MKFIFYSFAKSVLEKLFLGGTWETFQKNS